MYGIIDGKLQHGVTVRLDSPLGHASEPCGTIPTVGLPHFWAALDEHKRPFKPLKEQWEKQALVFVPLEFPVLAHLVEMQIDMSSVQAKNMNELLRELELGRMYCLDVWGIAIFDVLKHCATLALDQGTGLLLSPFQ